MPKSIRLLPIALMLVASSALAGCGKAVPVQQVPGLVDDVLTRKPLASARELPADQAQDNQQAKRTETSKVGAPSNEKN